MVLFQYLRIEKPERIRNLPKKQLETNEFIKLKEDVKYRNNKCMNGTGLYFYFITELHLNYLSTNFLIELLVP